MGSLVEDIAAAYSHTSDKSPKTHGRSHNGAHEGAGRRFGATNKNGDEPIFISQRHKMQQYEGYTGVGIRSSDVHSKGIYDIWKYGAF